MLLVEFAIGQARVVELSGNAKVAAQQLTELGAMLYNGRRFRDAVSTLNKVLRCIAVLHGCTEPYVQAVKADKSGCQTWVWLGHSQHQVQLLQSPCWGLFAVSYVCLGSGWACA